MAIKQNNKTQSDIRFNLSNILGLSEEQTKMLAQNQDRLRGGIAQTYFNGRNAGTETGGTDPTCTECGGGGGGGSGGGGGVVFPCNDCVTLAEAAEMSNTPCCISDGKDCETGENVPICLAENCGDYGKDCTPPPLGDCGTVVIFFTWTGGQSYKLTTLKKVASDINSGIDENFNKAVQYLGGGEIQNERTTSSSTTRTCDGETYNLNYTNAKRGFVVGSGWANSTASLQSNPNQTDYNKGLQNWTKPKGKYLKNGKFYDACGIEPQDCITVCDNKGNQYKICEKNGKPKITPVA